VRTWHPLVAAAALALALGCGGAGDGDRRVLIVGIDGATLRVIDPLLAAGRLPTLARLRAQGASGPLRSELPLASPRIWNSIATGKRPEAHGIEDFSYRDADGTRRLYLSRHRKVRALWNIASDAGREVAVVNWWNTFPPDRVRGVIVSDHALPGRPDALARETGAAAPPGGPTVFPPVWQSRIDALQQRPVLPEGLPDPLGEERELPDWVDFEDLRRFPGMDAGITAVALELSRELRPDLLMILLPGIDRVSHHLWIGLEPQGLYPPERFPLTRSEWQAAGDALRRYYAYTDALLARLIEHFDADDLVMVMSDHGFQGVTLPEARLTGHHQDDGASVGVWFARGPGIPPGSSTAGSTIYQVLPTVLTWMGLPVADDLVGAPADFLALAPARRVASYEGAPIERVEVGPSGHEREILEELRALGYLESERDREESR
jgi:hypothetical protein